MKVVGGDPTMMRAARLDPAFAKRHEVEVTGSIEVPCQDCGRMVLIAPSGQRVALGEPERLARLDLDALADNRVASIGPTVISEGSAPVICMWCALGEDPVVLRVLNEALAAAHRKLGEQRP